MTALNDTTTDEDLAYASAVGLRAAFRRGQLSPRAVLEAQLARIAAFDQRVGAVGELLELDGVRRAADDAGRRYRDGTARPLEGLTVAVKEEHPIAGVPLTLGSAALAPRIPGRSHPLVERLSAAGALVHARTTTPEFCAAGVTRSQLWGVTRSPWDLRRSSGGSSGGSGAALAAGFATLATGSDIAGSIRIPAAFCGVVGYKAPYARVPALAPANLDPYCHDGIMGRHVVDVALAYDEVAGRDARDLASVDGERLDGVPGVPLTGLRIGIAASPGTYPVAGEIVAAVEALAAPLARAGARVTDVRLPWNAESLTRAAFAHYGTIMAPYIRAELGSAYSEALPYTREFVECAERELARLGTFGALAAAAELQDTLAVAFAEADVLVLPCTSVSALDADPLPGRAIEVDGVRHQLVHHLQAALTIPFNVASRCPVFAVPVGRAGDGMPLSVQVVGAPYAERHAAAVADAIERMTAFYAGEGPRPALEP